jgi:hypothetical protein
MTTTLPNHLHHAAGRRRHVRSAGRRLVAVAIAIVAAIGVMAGESWVLKYAPATLVACDIGQASDFTRALDSGIAAVVSN